jgi:hypothetical protein
MRLDAFLSRARYAVLALPLFALFSTVHAGCVTGPPSYYGTYGGGYGGRRTVAYDLPPGDCNTFIRPSGYGNYVSYTTCIDDDDGYSYGP